MTAAAPAPAPTLGTRGTRRRPPRVDQLPHLLTCRPDLTRIGIADQLHQWITA